MRLLVNIDVSDLDRAIRFYTTALDLNVARRGDDVAELLGAEAPIYLLAKAEGSTPFPGAPRGRAYERHWTPVHLDFEVDDLAASLHIAEAAGARREGDVEEHAWGLIAYLSDPFGNGLCLIELRGRGYDELMSPPGAQV